MKIYYERGESVSLRSINNNTEDFGEVVKRLEVSVEGVETRVNAQRRPNMSSAIAHIPTHHTSPTKRDKQPVHHNKLQPMITVHLFKLFRVTLTLEPLKAVSHVGDVNMATIGPLITFTSGPSCLHCRSVIKHQVARNKW